MNKSKYILGIAITILGGSIVLESMISGIFHFTEKLYEDFKTYNIELQALQDPIKTSFFSVEEGQLFSVWLRCSTIQVENKNLKIAVSLIDEDGNIIREIQKDFRFGYFRDSAENIRYFKLGEYYFRKEFRGYLQYELDGTWTSTVTSALIVRISPPALLPLRQIGFFVVGIFALIVGIETIVKNSKKRITFKKDDKAGSLQLTNDEGRPSAKSL